MFRFLTRRMIDHLGRRFGYDVSYMHAMLDASPSAFRRFGKATALARHREVVDAAPHFAANLVGTLGEDCGPCTQIVADMAQRAGVPTAQIAAVLRGQVAEMHDDVALAYRFASAIFAASPDADALREQVRERWGDKGVVELTFALQGSRLYPMVKAGLGFAKECRQVTVGGESVWAKRQPA